MASPATPDHSQLEAPLIREAASLENVEEQDTSLIAELSRADSSLELSEDVDEDAGIFSHEHLLRAKSFLVAQSGQFRKICGQFPPAPRIGPGPNGSIDLYWKEKDWELLINIPAESGKMATFYGDDYGSQKIKGSFDPSFFHYGIVPWLIRS